MQPHILFPILIFAFGMGVFLTTFVGDVSSEEEYSSLDSEEIYFTKNSVLRDKKINTDRGESESNRSWLDEFQTTHLTDYHYPVTEVSIKIDKPSYKKFHSITTEYLEPYQNFCVNQVLNRVSNIRYSITEKDDKIRFKIDSINKASIDQIRKEFKEYEISIVQ